MRAVLAVVLTGLAAVLLPAAAAAQERHRREARQYDR